MKRQYVTPTVGVKTIHIKDVITTSSTSSDDTCDCWAHKGKHSKCSNGCHNSGQSKMEFDGVEPMEIDWNL